MIHNGLNIKRVAIEKKIGGSELARRLNQTPQSVNSLFRTKSINQEKLISVAEALGVDIQLLMVDSDNNRSNGTDLGPLYGDFETHTTKSGNEYSIVSDGNHRLTVKFVEQRAYAGYLAGWSDPVFIDTLPSTIITVKKFHTGTYRVFEVSGDSMDYNGKYAIQDGDSVIAHKVDRDLWKSKLHIRTWREWVIVHDEGIIIKHIVHHDVENCIVTCRSYNEDKDIYADFDLNLDDVYELYNVVKVEKNR
jgi:transcriptional regulator with XRE-family HTH domain